MSIRPTQFNDDDSIDVWHDERQHSGVISAKDIAFAVKADGSTNHDYIVLACPVEGCDSASLHPVSGGADPEAIQTLFAYAYKRDKSQPVRDVDTWEKAVERVRERTEILDGTERFRLEGHTQPVLRRGV